ncbi:MAG: hypothetical protein U0470_11880 [Anaerolineae bacterium]
MPPATPSFPARRAKAHARAVAIAVGATGAGVLAASLAALPASAQDAAPSVYCPGNRLINAGFEEGFSVRDRPDAIVGRGWSAWYDVPQTGGLTAPVFAPRRADEELLEVPFGMWLQQIGSTASPTSAGCGSRSRCPPTSSCRPPSGRSPGPAAAISLLVSNPPGTYATTLGVDPLGGTDPHAATVAWTAPITVTDRWSAAGDGRLSPGPRATLFVRGQPLAAAAHGVPLGRRLPARRRRRVRARAPLPATPRPTPTANPRRPGPTDDPILALLQGTALAAGAQAAATARAPLGVGAGPASPAPSAPRRAPRRRPSAPASPTTRCP